MKIKNKRCFFSFLLIILFSKATLGQNIKNDTVYLSTSSMIQIDFNSPIEKTVMPNGDGSYDTKVLNGTSIVITASKKNAKDQPLIVNEGKREHKFILSFKEGVPAAHVDWSDLKKLTAHVNKSRRSSSSVNQNQAATPAEETEQEKSKKALMEANALFKKGSLQEAKAKYGQVSDPDLIDLVSSRIDEINKLLQEEEKKGKEESDKKYKEAMVKANNLYTSGKFNEAKVSLMQALEYQPNDVYANNHLLLVNKKLAEQERLNETTGKETQFRNYVAKGDEAFKANLFENAGTKYEEALKIKPNNAGVIKKLSDTRKKIENEGFQQWKRKGDSALNKKDVPGARTAYNEALKIRPKDASVMSQLKRVSNLEDESGQDDKFRKVDSVKKMEYSKAISTADKFFDAKDYNFATEEYKRAGRIFPDSTYPVNQIKKINQLRADILKGKAANTNKN